MFSRKDLKKVSKKLTKTVAGLSRLTDQNSKEADRRDVLNTRRGHWASAVHVPCAPVCATSLRRMQCTMTMTKPSKESKTAKRIWNRAERRSVMASTADIQVRARRGNTTQELHKDALQVEKGTAVCLGRSEDAGETFLTFILKILFLISCTSFLMTQIKLDSFGC